MTEGQFMYRIQVSFTNLFTGFRPITSCLVKIVNICAYNTLTKYFDNLNSKQ